MSGWSEGSERQGLEVLHSSSEQELVVRAEKTAQPHTLEAMMGLQVGETHLDPFALIARLDERLGSHQPACHVAGMFMNIAENLS